MDWVAEIRAPPQEVEQRPGRGLAALDSLGLYDGS